MPVLRANEELTRASSSALTPPVLVCNEDAIDCRCFILGWQVSRWQTEIVSQGNEKTQNSVIVFSGHFIMAVL